MVPDLTRRQAIAAGGGGIALLATGGAALTPRDRYPGPVLDRLIGRRSKPDVDWQPPATEPLVAESREALAALVADARELWDRIDADRDELPEEARTGRSRLGDAEDALDALDEAAPGAETLSELHRAHASAGAALGAGEIALGRDDPTALRDRSEALRAEVADVGDAIAYELDVPREDVGWLYAVERELYFAFLNSHRNGVYTGAGPAPVEAYEEFPSVPVRTREAHARAAQHLRVAEHWYDAYRERLSSPSDVQGALETLRDSFVELVAAGQVPLDRQEETLADVPEGPVGHARHLLLQYTLRDVDPVDDGPADGRLVLQTVRAARNVAKVRAYHDAIEAFELAAGGRVPASLVHEAERRATERLRAVVKAYPRQLAAAGLEDAARRIHDAHLGLTDTEHRQYERAQAYVSYLVGDSQLRHLPDVLTPFDGERVAPDALE